MLAGAHEVCGGQSVDGIRHAAQAEHRRAPSLPTPASRRISIGSSSQQYNSVHVHFNQYRDRRFGKPVYAICVSSKGLAPRPCIEE